LRILSLLGYLYIKNQTDQYRKAHAHKNSLMAHAHIELVCYLVHVLYGYRNVADEMQRLFCSQVRRYQIGGVAQMSKYDMSYVFVMMY
jgi:hypothetical protein